MPQSPDLDPLQQFWDALLSRQPAQIRAVYMPLDLAARISVKNHLQRMVREAGWQPEQVQSAQAALDVIQAIL